MDFLFKCPTSLCNQPNKKVIKPLYNSIIISVYDDKSVSHMIREVMTCFNQLDFKAKIKDFIYHLEEYKKGYTDAEIKIYESTDRHFITRNYSELIIEELSETGLINILSNWGFYTGGAFLLGYMKKDRDIVDEFFKSTQFIDEFTFLDMLTSKISDYCFIRQGADSGIDFIINFKDINYVQQALVSHLKKSQIV